MSGKTKIVLEHLLTGLDLYPNGLASQMRFFICTFLKDTSETKTEIKRQLTDFKQETLVVGNEKVKVKRETVAQFFELEFNQFWLERETELRRITNRKSF